MTARELWTCLHGIILGAVFLLAVVLAPAPAAADLTVDTIDSNSPYMMRGDL